MSWAAMTQRIVQLVTSSEHRKALEKIHKRFDIEELWHAEDSDRKRMHSSFLVDVGQSQALLDVLRPLADETSGGRVVLLPVEATLPQQRDETTARGASLRRRRRLSQEELQQDISASAELDINFLAMVILSTIVAAIGLLENNEAVLVGAMVIAPFLGPNVALAFATAMGDLKLLRTAIGVNLLGFAVTLVMSIAIGALWSEPLQAREILSRTDVGYSGVVLALASGAAAVLALTSGSSSTLVGVMVAVALLPPACTLGMMLGSQHWTQAGGAALLLATNVICVNLSANLTFFTQGISPRRGSEKKRAARSFLLHRLFWLLMLVTVCALIWIRSLRDEGVAQVDTSALELQSDEGDGS